MARAGLFSPLICCATPLVHQLRLGVDVLDAIVVPACLATNQILASSVLAWSQSVARKLVQKTEDNSKKMLLNVFGKQPRFVWLLVDGNEVETALEKLKVGDIIVVHTGETVPVDGEVVDRMAMIDQHALTGESAPASTLMAIRRGYELAASESARGRKIRGLGKFQHYRARVLFGLTMRRPRQCE